MKKKVNILSLGCSKNTVDSEKIASALHKAGFEINYDGISGEGYDFVLINTCGFICDAKEESINTIIAFATEKALENLDYKIVVCGCLTQRYREEIANDIPEIDKIFGVFEEDAVVQYILDNSNEKIDNTRYLSNAKHFAYLKIAEGCDRHCSFCAIPMIKGRYVSRPMEDILEEANILVNQGVKELILIAQDTSCYGIDLYGENKLFELIEKLSQTDVHWIRLQYTYPNSFPERILDLMQPNSKLCHYLDMPLQHCNDKVLKSMNRNITKEQINNLLSKVRSKVEDIRLRTSLIVGYPNENKSDFAELMDFIMGTRFDRMGAFIYSKEEGTKAAELRNLSSERTKQNRWEELNEIQMLISLQLNREMVDNQYEVIIDDQYDGYYIGRTQYDSPEVDNKVLIPIENNKDLKIGEFYNVLITDAKPYDLIANRVLDQ